MSNLIDEFMAISGVSSNEEASNWLEMGNFNLETAIDLYFSNSSSHTTSGSTSKKNNNEDYFDPNQFKDNHDEVRPPDEVRTQKLIDDSYNAHFDPYLPSFINHLNGIRRRTEENNISSRNSEEDEENETNDDEIISSTKPSVKNFSTLFKIPTEIISKKNTLDDLFLEASENSKWLLINIQDHDNFNSHALNRDLWNTTHGQELVRNNFIFSQFFLYTPQASQYLKKFYPSIPSSVYKDLLPLVAIHEPRTRAEVFSISGDKLDNKKLFYKIQDFLGEYPVPDASSLKAISKFRSKNVNLSSSTSTSSSSSVSTIGTKRISDVIDIIDDDDQNKSKKSNVENIDLTNSETNSPPSPPSPPSTPTIPSLTELNSKTILALVQSDPQIEGDKPLSLKLRWSWGGNSLLRTSQTASVSHLLYFIANQVPSDKRDKILTIAYGHPTKTIELKDLDKKLEEIEIKENLLITVRLD